MKYYFCNFSSLPSCYFCFYTFLGHYENGFNLCLGMNLKILWDDLDDFGMALIKIG